MHRETVGLLLYKHPVGTGAGGGTDPLVAVPRVTLVEIYR